MMISDERLIECTRLVKEFQEFMRDELEARRAAPRDDLLTELVKARDASGEPFSMAEMISSRAAAREKRLADGGEKRMRKVEIKEKDEYKKDFSNIVTEAASMGRLTRLNEHVVEATAVDRPTN